MKVLRGDSVVLFFVLASLVANNTDDVSAFTPVNLPATGGRSIHNPHGTCPIGKSVAASTSKTERFFNIAPAASNYVVPPTGSPPTNETMTTTAGGGAGSFLAEREANVNKIMSNVPSLTDLYSATVTIKKAIEEKEKVYSQIISKLETEQDNSLKAIEAWQGHYNNTITNLQKQVDRSKRDEEAKEKTFQRQIQQIEEESEGKVATALDKVNWLTKQLHQLQIKTQKQQLEANQAAQKKETALLSRIDELQYKLSNQIKATEEAGEKAESYLQERMAVQAELAKLTEEHQKTLEELNQKLSAEKVGRTEDKRMAEEKLVKERDDAKEQIMAAQKEAREQKTAMDATLRTKEEEYSRSMKEMRESALDKETQLNQNIDKLNDEMNQIKADADKRLADEKEAAMKVQDDLREQIRSKENELQEQISLKNIQISAVEDLFEKRAELGQELSDLKKKYEAAVFAWEAKSFKLEAEHAEEMEQAEAKLVEEREAARKEIEAALQEVEEQKIALKRGLEAKDKKHMVDTHQLRLASSKKEEELKETLQVKSEELEKLQFVSQKNLMAEKEEARAEQDKLIDQISEKEKELEDQVSLTEEMTEKADGLWEHRMELEKDLASLRNEHKSVTMDWKRRHNELEAARLKESRAAEKLLANKEADARKEVEAAKLEVEETKAALESGLASKDNNYKQRIRELQAAAVKKEKELSANLKRMGENLQDLRFESHQKMMAEKETATKKAEQLLAEIGKKEKELEEKTAETTLQSSRVDELWEKRMQLELDLSAANKKYTSALLEFEGVFKTQEDARAKEKREAKELLAKKEAEAKAKIEAAVEEAESLKAALKSGLKSRDAQYKQMADKLRSESDSNEKKLRDCLDKVANEFQQYKFDSHKNLMAEKLAFEKKEADLLAQIKDIEEELGRQSDMTVQNDAKVDDLWKARTELEVRLNDTKAQHKAAVSDWKERYNLLEDARARDQKDAAQVLARTEAENRVKVEAAVAKGNEHKAKLNDCLDAIASQESELQAEMDRMATMLGEMQTSIANVKQMAFSECKECNKLP